MQLMYIDDTNIYSSYGVFMIEEKGLFDPLIAKHKYKYDWPDEHGVQYSHTDKLMKPRKFSLLLGIKSTSKTNYKQGIHNFLELFTAAGMRMLRLQDIDKVYMVDINGKKPMQRLTHWNDTFMVGRFQINLIEPEPINRQYYSTGTSVTVTLTTDNDELFTIYWGDGSVDTITEATSPVTNSGLGTGKYIVVAGRKENISSLNVSNSTEVTW